jgi:hypothetical protein
MRTGEMPWQATTNFCASLYIEACQNATLISSMNNKYLPRKKARPVFVASTMADLAPALIRLASHVQATKTAQIAAYVLVLYEYGQPFACRSWAA